ncbi:unnamed protein product [Brachionus calyciflorus]|uniref:Serine/threonine-protein phosphatase n=1 Tax=Brachionus calyciflorus TaxID=104777 RepID=A0A813TZS1_9BILA|nr:unnamed protein product [Brachionus calyciflorus]
MEKKESKKNENDLNEALTRVLNILEMEHREDLINNSEIFNQLLAAFSIDLVSQIIPTGIAPDYVGVHLGPSYDDYNFKQLIKSFKNNQILDPFYTLKILKDAKEKLEKLSNIQECLIEDPLESGCIVIGDLHGNFNDLNHIISKYGVPGADFKYIFNGDYVDRGEKQIEVLLTILYAFLIRPDRVFVNRGNHEDIQMNVRPWSKINFLNHHIER